MDTAVTIAILAMMFMLGAVFGSFACCQAWRWRYHAVKKKDLGQWSVCMHCKKRIKWYDNIPIFSWLILRGKCRNCHKKIGIADFLSEISLAVAFLMMSWAYLLPILTQWDILALHPEFLAVRLAIFVVILILLVVLMVLAVYDAKWGELPTVLLMLAIIIGAMVFLLKIYEERLVDNSDVLGLMWSALGGVLILSGTCFVIYKASKERLMGGRLATCAVVGLGAVGLVVGALDNLLANLLGDVIALPSALKKKGHVVHFGPFLVAAFVIVMVLGNCLPLLIQVGI